MPHEDNLSLTTAMGTFEALVAALTAAVMEGENFASVTHVTQQTQKLVIPLLNAAIEIIYGVDEVFSDLDIAIFDLETKITTLELNIAALEVENASQAADLVRNKALIDNHEQRLQTLEDGA